MNGTTMAGPLRRIRAFWINVIIAASRKLDYTQIRKSIDKAELNERIVNRYGMVNWW